jgi:hypothetical protein
MNNQVEDIRDQIQEYIRNNDFNNNNLLSFFDNIEEQERFIEKEQELFNMLSNNENLSLEILYFLMNDDYLSYWDRAIKIDLENLPIEEVLNLDYIYNNTLQDYNLIISLIENNTSIRELVNILKSFSLYDYLH